MDQPNSQITDTTDLKGQTSGNDYKTTNSRVKKSILNARINMICYFVSLLTAFFTRRTFIDYLGLEFMGLTGSIASLMGFLNLAELGIGGSIAFLLYKPVLDRDRFKINELISVMGYLYRWIGVIIISAGIILSLFFPLIFPDTGFSMFLIYFVFFCSLGNSMWGYFFNYKMAIMSADQRNYLITGYFQATTSARLIAQMVFAIIWANFYLYVIIEVVFAIINTLLINWKLRKTYPWLKTELKQGRKLLKKYPEVKKYMGQIFIHNIGGFVQMQTLPLIIYGYVSLPVVTLYNNYTTITIRCTSFFNGIINSVGAGIGNLIAEGDREKIFTIYQQLFSGRFYVIGTVAAGFMYLISPFVAVWLGPECVLDNTVVTIIIIQYFLGTLRGITDNFISGFGLYRDVWAPVSESAFFLIMTITLGARFGLLGIVLGPLIATIVFVYLWKPYWLFTRGMKRSVWAYWYLFIRCLLPMLVAYVAGYVVAEALMGYFDIAGRLGAFVVRTICFGIPFIAVATPAMWLCVPPFKTFILRFYRAIFKRRLS